MSIKNAKERSEYTQQLTSRRKKNIKIPILNLTFTNLQKKWFVLTDMSNKKKNKLKKTFQK